MSQILEKIICYHCGDECTGDIVVLQEKQFCCVGCKLVYEILQENNLCSYYELSRTPGIKQNNITSRRYNFLDEPAVKQKLISFQFKKEVRITFEIPSMHCSSCIWLLENLRKINGGIISSRVNFMKKELVIVYDESKTTLRKIVEELASTGYEPSLHLDALGEKEKRVNKRNRILSIGIAGFCFGNIMMLSFPEYFSSGKIIDPGLKQFFSYMNLLLSLPVFFYCASEFFVKSYIALKHKTSSIDLPIALGIAAIFLRSTYEIVSQTGVGYLDSGSGLVFFMLIGRWFQDFTFDSMAFDRDYKSYFPIAVTTLKSGKEVEVTVSDLKVNDRILIRNNEIVPVDALLLKGNASIDYHFVTGESVPVNHQPGETLFAGGRQTGSLIELQVTKELSQSYLTQLWNHGFSNHARGYFERIVQSVSKWFIVFTLFIAIIAAAFWWNTDMHKAINAFTAVLIIACPCALALSAPFTYGNILRILGRNKIYLRDYHTLERLADIDMIVFDKTGTLTENSKSEVFFVGECLSDEELKMIYSLVRHSAHPLSKLLAKSIGRSQHFQINDYKEELGQGISAMVNHVFLKAGNLHFVGSHKDLINDKQTKVCISLNSRYRGYFVFSNTYRKGIKKLTSDLYRKKYKLAVLTGDDESERANLETLFTSTTEMLFNQSPKDKFDFINNLQKKKLKVMMIGDGLNDAGALLQSDVGISLTENTNAFTPASDGIVDATALGKLANLFIYSKAAIRIIVISFIISLVYNFVGLSFAVSGTLSPLIAAILMPVSTISLVLFTVIASTVKGKMLKFC